MARKWLKNRLPDAASVHRELHDRIGGTEQSTGLRRWVRNTFAQPMVWHLNRRSVAGGVAVGLFVSWVPVPLQMLFAAVLAAVLRVHVPVSVVMVWFRSGLAYVAYRHVVLRKRLSGGGFCFDTNAVACTRYKAMACAARAPQCRSLGGVSSYIGDLHVTSPLTRHINVRELPSSQLFPYRAYSINRVGY